MGAIVFSFVNKKGGVGKTTIAANIGQLLAISGYKVLCIDNDEQHNLSNTLGLSNCKVDISDLYNGGISFKDFVNVGILKTLHENLYCVPSSSNLSNIKIKDSGVLSKLIDVTNFDYVLIDCAPGSGLVQNEMAIKVSDYYLLPVLLKQYSISGLQEMVSILTKKYSAPIENIRIIPNGVSVSFAGNFKIKKHLNYITALNTMFPNNVTDSFIPDDEMLDTMVTEKKSIFINRFFSSRSSKYFLELMEELFSGINSEALEENILEQRRLYRVKIAKSNLVKNKISKS